MNCYSENRIGMFTIAVDEIKGNEYAYQTRK